MVTDGEQFRRHFVHGFAGALEGVDPNKLVRRSIRGDRYEADCPTIVGPVRRRASVHGDEIRFARDETAKRLKVTLPGPMTIVDTLNDDHYGSREKAAFAFAHALRYEIEDLVALGVDARRGLRDDRTRAPLSAGRTHRLLDELRSRADAARRRLREAARARRGGGTRALDRPP